MDKTRFIVHIGIFLKTIVRYAILPDGKEGVMKRITKIIAVVLACIFCLIPLMHSDVVYAVPASYCSYPYTTNGEYVESVKIGQASVITCFWHETYGPKTPVYAMLSLVHPVKNAKYTVKCTYWRKGKASKTVQSKITAKNGVVFDLKGFASRGNKVALRLTLTVTKGKKSVTKTYKYRMTSKGVLYYMGAK